MLNDKKAEGNTPYNLTAEKLAKVYKVPSVHPDGVPHSQRVRCYNCGKPGHLSYDCATPQVRKACYSCGQTGHISRLWYNGENHHHFSFSYMFLVSL